MLSTLLKIPPTKDFVCGVIKHVGQWINSQSLKSARFAIQLEFL